MSSNELAALVGKWRANAESSGNNYWGENSERRYREQGMSDAYTICADELEAALGAGGAGEVHPSGRPYASKSEMKRVKVLTATPPAQQAKPRKIDRWNIEANDEGFLVCEGDHEKYEGCIQVQYVPKPAAQQAAPEGWVLVPRVLSRNMLTAMRVSDHWPSLLTEEANAIWAAALAAAPAPQGE
jgi:hypothetical protein